MRGRTSSARGRSYRELGLTTAVVDTCGRALAAIELLAGFPETAERLLRECCAELQELHQTSVLATRAAELAAALYEQGRYDEAADWVRVARDLPGTTTSTQRCHAQPVEAKILARQGARSGGGTTGTGSV